MKTIQEYFDEAGQAFAREHKEAEDRVIQIVLSSPKADRRELLGLKKRSRKPAAAAPLFEDKKLF